MGLKDDIYNSLVKNLGEDNVTATPKSQEKVDTLAQDLTDSIITFIQAQEFTITSMQASQVGIPTWLLAPYTYIASIRIIVFKLK